MMIVCPNCKKRFDIDPGRVEEDKKLRCSSCRAVFRLVRKSRPGDVASPAQQPAPPAPPSASAPPSAPPAPPSTPLTHPAATQVAPRAAAEGALSASGVTVVVANESAPFCDAVRKVLADEEFAVVTCNDGKVALETVERLRPDVLLLDVALPTMFGFEVCERVRQNPDLAHVKIVLIASIYDKTRYKRSPNSLYGADDYIEKHHIPDSLVPMIHRLASGSLQAVHSHTPEELAEQEATRSRLRQVEVRETTADDVAAESAAAHAQPPLETLGLEAAMARPGAEPAAQAPVAADPVATAAPAERSFAAAFESADPPAAAAAESVALQEIDPFAELAIELAETPAQAQPPAAAAPPAAAVPQLSEAEVKAKRLARIIVSDIGLYNQGKVEQGVREGTFYELLADDIREGERLYRQRVAEQVRETTTFLKDAFEEFIAKKRAELRV